MNGLKRNIWMAALLAGVLFVVAGGVMVTQGLAARADIEEGLEAEAVTIGSDGELFGVEPGTAVTSAETALAQANIIRYHSLGGEPEVVDGEIVGGVPYAGMERDDPARATYLNGVTLRSSLMLAYMGFKVTDLILGVGGLFIVLGLSLAGLVAPALYWARVETPAAEAERAVATQPRLAA